MNLFCPICDLSLDIPHELSIWQDYSCPNRCCYFEFIGSVNVFYRFTLSEQFIRIDSAFNKTNIMFYKGKIKKISRDLYPLNFLNLKESALSIINKMKNLIPFS